jgi:predicted DNA-binding protein
MGKYEKTTLRVSEKAYEILDYGSKVLNITKAEYVDRLIDWFIKRDSRLIEELEQKSHQTETSHSELIEEGLKLIGDIDLEKAKELREKLKRLESHRIDNSEPESHPSEAHASNDKTEIGSKTIERQESHRS